MPTSQLEAENHRISADDRSWLSTAEETKHQRQHDPQFRRALAGDDVQFGSRRLGYFTPDGRAIKAWIQAPRPGHQPTIPSLAPRERERLTCEAEAQLDEWGAHVWGVRSTAEGRRHIPVTGARKHIAEALDTVLERTGAAIVRLAEMRMRHDRLQYRYVDRAVLDRWLRWRRDCLIEATRLAARQRVDGKQLLSVLTGVAPREAGSRREQDAARTA